MQLKIFSRLGLSVVALLVVAVGVAWYLQTQKSRPDSISIPVTLTKVRNAELKDKLENLKIRKSCQERGDKVNCFNEYFTALGGISYGTDLGLFSGAAREICGSDMNCFLLAIDQMVNSFQIEILKQKLLPQSSVQASEGFRTQLQFSRNYLLSHRALISKRFTAADKETQARLLNYVNSVDNLIKKIDAEK